MNLWKVLKQHFFQLGGFVGLLLFFVLLYKLYIPHITAFGCFDDCFNFMGGYFLLHGKQLYTQIFFNHAPLMAYLSAFVQSVFHPINIFDVVLRHRQFLFGFSLLMTIILFFRFGWKVLLFSTIYELTKFYVFGDRFLAEGFVVYPAVYLAGVVWEKVRAQHTRDFDIVAAAVATWFVIFMREPYALVALVMYGYILWRIAGRKKQSISLGIFLILSVTTILFHNVSDFYFNVVTVSSNAILGSELTKNSIAGIGAIKILLYPLLVFWGGKWGFFRYILLGTCGLFVIESVLLLFKNQWRLVVAAWIILGLSNIRFTIPGQEYYEAFHMIVWYGLLLFFSTAFLEQINGFYKILRYVLAIGFVALVSYCVIPPSPFFYAHFVEHEEFITNYGYDLQVGNIIADITSPTDTVFLDGTEDIIYLVAKRYSAYPYSWYTSAMPEFTTYTKARHDMFVSNPPSIYFGSCKSWPNRDSFSLAILKKDYQVLYTNGKPSCLWVKKTKLPEITREQWDKVNAAFYSLP